MKTSKYCCEKNIVKECIFVISSLLTFSGCDQHGTWQTMSFSSSEVLQYCSDKCKTFRTVMLQFLHFMLDEIKHRTLMHQHCCTQQFNMSDWQHVLASCAKSCDTKEMPMLWVCKTTTQGAQFCLITLCQSGHSISFRYDSNGLWKNRITDECYLPTNSFESVQPHWLCKV